MSVKNRCPIVSLRCEMLVNSLRRVLADQVSDLLLAHWPAATAKVNGAWRFLRPLKPSSSSCSRFLSARLASALERLFDDSRRMVPANFRRNHHTSPRLYSIGFSY